MTRPAVSQHLAILGDSELVIVRREGTRRLYLANRQAAQDAEAIAKGESEAGSAKDGDAIILLNGAGTFTSGAASRVPLSNFQFLRAIAVTSVPKRTAAPDGRGRNALLMWSPQRRQPPGPDSPVTGFR